MYFKSVLFFVAAIFLMCSAQAANPQLQFEGSWNRGTYVMSAYTPNQRLVAIFENGLDVFQTDVQGPLLHLGRLGLGFQKPKSLVAANDTAYVLTKDALLIIDLRNPQAPRQVAELAVEALSAFLDQTTLYLFGSSITRIDITAPAAPQILSETPVSDSIHTGYMLGECLVTVNQDGFLDIWKTQPDGSLEATRVNPPFGIQLSKHIAFQGDRIYSAERGIQAFQITTDGEMFYLGFFQSNLVIEGIALYDGAVAISGYSFPFGFEGLEVVRLGDQGNPFLGSARLAKGRFTSITGVTPQLFFGLSEQRGIEQFRPEASFAKTTAFEQTPLAQDVAFKDPYVFLASVGKLEVLSFADPDAPMIVHSYAVEEAPFQKLVFDHQKLHLANASIYRRYAVAMDGSLVEEHSLPMDLEADPIHAMEVHEDKVFFASGMNLTLILGDRVNTAPLFPTHNSSFSSISQVVIEYPYVLRRVDNILDIFRYGEFNFPSLIATKELTRVFTQEAIEGIRFLPHPTTLHGQLLISGNQIFNARNMECLVEFPRAATNLESAISQDDLLYGVGPNGLQIWDFQNPAAPELKWERVDFPGDRVFLDQDKLLVFEKNPNFLSYFSSQVEEGGGFFPYLRNGLGGAEQLVFNNSASTPALVTLKGIFHSQEVVEHTLVLPPLSTQSQDLSNLFGRTNHLSLSILAPRAVSTTYHRKGNFFINGNVSPSLAAPIDLESLSNRVTVHLPSSPDRNKVVISSPDFGSDIRVNLKFLSNQGILEEKDITLVKGIGFIIIPGRFFESVSEGQQGAIIATSPEGTRIGGMAFANEYIDAEATSKGFSNVPPMTSPLRANLFGQLEYGDSFENMYHFGEDLLLAGASGLLIADSSGKRTRISAEHQVYDAVMDDTRVWVLTHRTLEVWDRAEGRLIQQLPNSRGANRLKRQENYLFLWNSEKVSLQMVEIADPDHLVLRNLISNQGDTVFDVLLQNNQLFISTLRGVFIFGISLTGELVSQGSFRAGVEPTALSSDGESLFLTSYDGIFHYALQPDAAPIYLSRTVPFGELLFAENGWGLFHINERDFLITNLSDFTEGQYISDLNLNLVRGVRFSDKTLWVNTQHNGIFQYDIQIPENPVLTGEISLTTAFDYLAHGSAGIFATGIENGHVILHQLSLEGGNLKTQRFNLGEGFTSGIFTQGEYVYVSDFNRGLITVHLNPETGPIIVSEDPGSFRQMVGNEHMLVSKEGGTILRIYTLENPAAPNQISEVQLDNYSVSGFQLDGNLLLMVSEAGGFRILNLNNPQMPEYIGDSAIAELKLPSGLRNIAVHKNHAYLNSLTTTTVLDYSDPNHPIIVNRLPIRGFTIQVHGGYLFQTGNPFTSIFDISNPAMPRYLGLLEVGPLFSAMLKGNTFWMNDGSKLQALRFQPIRATIPWVAKNNKFETRIQLSNTSNLPQALRLRGVDPAGNTQTMDLELPGYSQRELASSLLFPEMAGYALAIETPCPEINASFATLGLDAEGTVVGQAQAQAIPSNQLRDSLFFNFPGQNAISAFSLLTPFSNAIQPVHLQLFGPNGFLEETWVELHKDQPIVYLVTTLFREVDEGKPFRISASTLDGTVLTGTTFVFQDGALPATSEGFPESAVYLPNSE